MTNTKFTHLSWTKKTSRTKTKILFYHKPKTKKFFVRNQNKQKKIIKKHTQNLLEIIHIFKA